MSATYRAYGLTVASEVPLPEFLSGEGPADLSVRYGTVELPPTGGPEPWYRWEVSESAFRLCWEGVGRFQLRNRSELTVDPAPDVEPGRLRDFLIGSVLAAVLQRRGWLLLLHAGAVSLGGGAVAFCGPSGEGKSTLTGALLRRGHPLVADDIVPIQLTGAGPEVQCAFPRMKLTPASAAALGCDPATLAPIYTGEEKSAWKVELAEPLRPLPLRRIYLLASGDTLAVSRPSAADALRGIVGQSFHRRLFSPEQLLAHFQLCTELARAGYIRRLTRPRTLEGLDAVAELVERDLAAA